MGLTSVAVCGLGSVAGIVQALLAFHTGATRIERPLLPRFVFTYCVRVEELDRGRLACIVVLKGTPKVLQ